MPSHKNKKRKQRDFDTNRNSTSSQIPPPTKRQKINKRPSKKPVLSSPTEPNSHVTITFGNINGTIDAIILPTKNVLAMNSDVLLENKGKLSIKTSDPIQNDITPQIPIDIKILTTPNIKTIHPRNSFRMGTSLFYCSDEARLFWSFPLRNTRRVSCQHYCCAVSKIVTRSVGIHSNKCNGKHSTSTPCIYAVCNAKPPKGIIPAKLFANYQFFQHSSKTELLVPRDPNDEKFQKAEHTNNSSTMYSNIKLIEDIGVPPPLAPMEDAPKHNANIKVEFESTSNYNPIKVETDAKRRRQQNINNGELVPFQQNVQIDLKALSKRKQRLKLNHSCITSSSSTATDPESHDYSDLLLHSTSSVVRDTQQTDSEIAKHNEKLKANDIKKYIRMLMNREFDELIAILKQKIPVEDHIESTSKKRKAKATKDRNEDELNGYRLLIANALYYRDNVCDDSNDRSSARHFCNLIVSNADENDVRYYEARKIRGLIHKKLSCYKAACHDLEFIAFNNPYHKTWSDRLYGSCGQSNFLENKIVSPKVSSRKKTKYKQVSNISNTSIEANTTNVYHAAAAAAPRLNEIITTNHALPHSMMHNPAYYNMRMSVTQNAIFGGLNERPQLDNDTLNMLAMNMVNNAMNSAHLTNDNSNNRSNNNTLDLSNPHAPIIYIPPIMDRSNKQPNEHTMNTHKLGINLDDFHVKDDCNKNKSPTKSASVMIDPALLDINYSDLAQIGDPKTFTERQTSNTSFDGLIALTQAATQNDKQEDDESKAPKSVLNAEDLLKDLGGFEAITRKTTREELLGDLDGNMHHKTVQDANEAIGDRHNIEHKDRHNINADDNNLLIMAPLQKTVSTTPEPLERIRSDALVRNDSQ